MDRKSGYDLRKVMHVMAAVLRRWWYAGVLLMTIAAVTYASAETAQKSPRILPPQEVAMRTNAYILMGEIEKAIGSSYAHWADESDAREKWLRVAKKADSSLEPLERTLGPVEIAYNETFEQATRAVVPLLSGRARNRTSGEVTTISGFGALIIERQSTAPGSPWHIISSFDPKHDEIKATWLSLARKKLPDSPILVLRKAVVVQAILEGKVVSEKVIFADDPNSR
jgi:hypothetical protein